MRITRSRTTPLLLGLLAATALPGVWSGATLAAQEDSTATIRGSVRIESGLPVAEVLVTATRADEECAAGQVLTLSNGGFTLNKLVPGQYTILVRRLGYEPVEATLAVGEKLTRYDAVITPKPALLTFSQLAAGWTGVVGLVGNAETMEPLADARITAMGSKETVTTDAQGRFAIPISDFGAGALRVERDGYKPQLVSFLVGEGDRDAAVVVLDSGDTPKSWASVWTDLNQRAQWGTPRTVRVGRAELMGTGAGTLIGAMEQAPTVKASGVMVSRLSCVFVDGLPRPGYPLDAIRTDKVEFVEAYPEGTELSRTLVNRWPPGGACGSAGADIITRRAIESGTSARWVVVWTR